MQTNMKVGLVIALFQVCNVHLLVFGDLANLVLNKLAKPGDAIAISKSETITHSLTPGAPNKLAKLGDGIPSKTIND